MDGVRRGGKAARKKDTPNLYRLVDATDSFNRATLFTNFLRIKLINNASDYQANGPVTD